MDNDEKDVIANSVAVDIMRTYLRPGRMDSNGLYTSAPRIQLPPWTMKEKTIPMPNPGFMSNRIILLNLFEMPINIIQTGLNDRASSPPMLVPVGNPIGRISQISLLQFVSLMQMRPVHDYMARRILKYRQDVDMLTRIIKRYIIVTIREWHAHRMQKFAQDNVTRLTQEQIEEQITDPKAFLNTMLNVLWLISTSTTIPDMTTTGHFFPTFYDLLTYVGKHYYPLYTEKSWAMTCHLVLFNDIVHEIEQPDDPVLWSLELNHYTTHQYQPYIQSGFNRDLTLRAIQNVFDVVFLRSRPGKRRPERTDWRPTYLEKNATTNDADFARVGKYVWLYAPAKSALSVDIVKTAEYEIMERMLDVKSNTSLYDMPFIYSYDYHIFFSSTPPPYDGLLSTLPILMQNMLATKLRAIEYIPAENRKLVPVENLPNVDRISKIRILSAMTMRSGKRFTENRTGFYEVVPINPMPSATESDFRFLKNAITKQIGGKPIVEWFPDRNMIILLLWRVLVADPDEDDMDTSARLMQTLKF